MKIVNAREYELEIAATGDVVAPGDAVEVSDDLGAALLEQPANWLAASKSSNKQEK